jgi:hypothetical protein
MGNGPQALKKGLESSVCVKGKNRLLRECPNHAHGDHKDSDLHFLCWKQVLGGGLWGKHTTENVLRSQTSVLCYSTIN